MVTETRVKSSWAFCTVRGRKWVIERPDSQFSIGVCTKCGGRCERGFNNRIFMEGVINIRLNKGVGRHVHRKADYPIGTIKRGKELGYKTDREYVWKACKNPQCGKTRWVQKHPIESEEEQRCGNCRKERASKYLIGSMRF